MSKSPMKRPRGWEEYRDEEGRRTWSRFVGHYKLLFWPTRLTGEVQPMPSASKPGCTFHLDVAGREWFSPGYDVTVAVLSAVDVLAIRVAEHAA